MQQIYVQFDQHSLSVCIVEKRAEYWIYDSPRSARGRLEEMVAGGKYCHSSYPLHLLNYQALSQMAEKQG